MWGFSDDILSFIAASFKESFITGQLIGTSPGEAFMLRIKLSIVSAFVVFSPVLAHQIWKFIEPGLYKDEKRFAVPFILSATLLFLTGGIFAYKFVLPITMSFFYEQYLSSGVMPTIKISEHVSMVVQILTGFGVSFELPVISWALARSGFITADTLIGGVRYAIVGIFVVSAVLTPPDAISQLLMAGPLLVLYGVSILVARSAARKE